MGATRTMAADCSHGAYVPEGEEDQTKYSRPPTHRGTFQDPQWMLETADSTEPYIHYDFPTGTDL